MQLTLTYALRDGTEGVATTLPIDIAMAERERKRDKARGKFLNFVEQDPGYDELCWIIHQVLTRRARSEGGGVPPYDEWLANHLESFDRVPEDEEAGDEPSPLPVTASNGQQPVESVF